MHAHTVMNAAVPRSASKAKAVVKKKDRHVAIALERAGDEAQKAVAILVSGYCANDPALVLNDDVRALRVRALGTPEQTLWTAALNEAVASEVANEVAARLDRHRMRRRMSPARFAQVLLTYI